MSTSCWGHLRYRAQCVAYASVQDHDELAHAGDNGDVVDLSGCKQSVIERTNCYIVQAGAHGGHVQHFAHIASAAADASSFKLPRDAISPEALLSALSRHAERGRVVFVSEGDPEHETVYTLGGPLKQKYRDRERYVLRQEPREALRVAPGDRVSKSVVLVHQWGDEIEIVPRVRDADRDVTADIARDR